MARKAAHILTLLRPKQWTKNLLLLAGLIFSANLFQFPLLYLSLVALLSFCLLSSCVYIINDIADLEEDRRHPKKQRRPLAAGLITKSDANIVLAVLLPLAAGLAWWINTYFLLLAAVYFLLSLVYILRFKYMVILDVFSIAFGFLLRALAGGAAIQVEISPWLLVCTLFLALFLALTKRRQEAINLDKNISLRRSVLEHYPLPYLDQLISIVTAATILAYSFYTFTAGQSTLFMLTIPFVIYGIFRYLYLVHKEMLGESPEEVLLSDTPMIVNILLWVIISIILLYFIG